MTKHAETQRSHGKKAEEVDRDVARLRRELGFGGVGTKALMSDAQATELLRVASTIELRAPRAFAHDKPFVFLATRAPSGKRAR